MMDYLMFKQGIDVKEFGEKLLTKVLYSSSVESKDDYVSIMLKTEVIAVGKIDTSKWEPFKIRSLFTVKRPAARSQSKYDDGDVPFVASGNHNNGVLKYLCPKTGEILDKGNCITVSPIDGSAFIKRMIS